MASVCCSGGYNNNSGHRKKEFSVFHFSFHVFTFVLTSSFTHGKIGMLNGRSELLGC